MAYDPIADIERLKETQKQQVMASLEQAKQASLSGLTQYQQGKANEYNQNKINSTGELDQYKNNQITNLTNTKNQNISTLDAEQKALTPMYYDKRNQTSTASQLQAKNFAEYMANRGLSSSGTSAQGELMRNATLQNNIGSLNRQETAANQDVLRRKTDVNTTFDNNVLGVNNDYALKLKQLDDAYNANVLALQNEILGKTNDVNSQYNNNLSTKYADIESNASSQIVKYREQLEELARQEAEAERQRQYQAEQNRIAWERQQQADAEQRAWQQQQAEAEYQRQLNLAKQKSSSSSTSDRGNSTKGNNVTTMAWESFANELNQGTGQAATWLEDNKDDLKESIGSSEYNDMIDTFAAAQEEYQRQSRRNMNSSPAW
jgi:hypothetical protein